MCEPTKAFQSKNFPWDKRDTIFALGLWVTGAVIIVLFGAVIYGLATVGL
jgi:hypothetical protein